jgi:hypothetical protein
VPALEAEIQVAGLAEPLDAFSVRLAQPTDLVGRPSTTVRVQPLLLTLTGLAAAREFFTGWAADNYLRRSGWLVVYESGQVRWRLAFYDAYCVLYNVRFRPGRGAAAYELTLALAPAAVNLNGIHSELYSTLWWEKDPAARFRNLTAPAALLPGPSARLASSERPPDPAPLPSPAPNTVTKPPLVAKPPKTALDPKKKPLYAPTIAKWYNKGGSIELLDNGNWKFTDWEHNAVEYEGDEPNFDRYARQQVDIEDMQGDCTTDFDKAEDKAPLGPKQDDSTWHHKQNMKTMQELPQDIHKRFTHYGGRFMIKKTKLAASTPVKKFIKRSK